VERELELEVAPIHSVGGVPSIVAVLAHRLIWWSAHASEDWSLGMSHVALADSPAEFRYESEMIPALRAALPDLAFGHRYRPYVEVFTEVPAVHGRPDVVGVRFDADALRRRTLAGIVPLSGDAEVRAIHALGKGGAEIGEIAARIGMSRDYVRRAVVPLLSDLGWIVRDAERVVRRPEADWAGQRVVTVEAKLRDWRRALAQARRQKRSADAAYIALDARSSARVAPHAAQIAQGGIGVLSVHPNSGRVHVLARPAASPKRDTAVGRALIAERALEMMNRGTREGQISPVFGWTLPLPE
jgi:hypothetical protein